MNRRKGKGVRTVMSEKEKREIAEMVKTAKYLAENDQQGFMLAKNSLDILKARCDMEKVQEGKKTA